MACRILGEKDPARHAQRAYHAKAKPSAGLPSQIPLRPARQAAREESFREPPEEGDAGHDHDTHDDSDADRGRDGEPALGFALAW